MKKQILTFLVLLLFPFLLITAVSAMSDPTPDPLIYSTYLGAELSETGRAIALDSAGNMYVTGETQSTSFPTALNAPAPYHGIDVFIAKFNAASGNADYTIWVNASTLFAEDYAYGIAVGDDGSAYITGDTRSTDFCQYFGDVPGFDQTYNDNGDAFILKIKPDGSGLDYCTYIGGTEADIGRAITIDDDGNAYVVGSTWSDVDFPTTPTAYDTEHNGLRDSFIVKLDATGTELLYSTFLGGSGQDEAVAVAIDANRQAVVTGWTFSIDFPTATLAYDNSYNGAADTFVAKFSADGSTLSYATLLGSGQDDRPTGIALDAAGLIHITGYTYSFNFPTTPGAVDRFLDGPSDAFVTKFSQDNLSLAYSTFIGGTSEDWGSDLTLDINGDTAVTGRTWSANFPTTVDAYDTDLSGERDGFIVRISQDGTQLLYGSYLGGSDWDDALAIDGNGHGDVYITGTTRSADFPTTANAYDLENNGDYDIFVSHLALATIADTYLGYLPVIQSP